MSPTARTGIYLFFLALGASVGCSVSHDPPGGADGGPLADSGPGAVDAAPADAGSFDVGLFDAAPIEACDFATMLDRSCGVDGDCAFALHTTDCCGNSIVTGFNSSESATFGARESACDETYPACGCPAFGPTADSMELVTDPSAVQVGCISRGPRSFCMTYVTTRPLDAD